jgi:hypothetical protein
LQCSDTAGKQTEGPRDLLHSKCELVPIMAEASRGVQRKKSIVVMSF